MNCIKKIIFTSFFVAVAQTLYAGTTVGALASGSISEVNRLSLMAHGISITTSSEGAGTLNGGDAFTIWIANNNTSGYTITVESTYGYLKEINFNSSNTPKDGEAIHYMVVCDDFDTLASTTETISANQVEITSSDPVALYEVNNPDAATCLGYGSGCKYAPNCDIVLPSHEDIDETFDGSYHDAITYEITSNL